MKKKLCLMLAMLLVAGMIIPSNVSARTVCRNNYRNMIYAAVSPGLRQQQCRTNTTVKKIGES